MKSKWTTESIEIISEQIPGSEMKKRIELVAEVLYDWCCQLHNQDALIQPDLSEGNQTNEWRSGTHA